MSSILNILFKKQNIGLLIRNNLITKHYSSSAPRILITGGLGQLGPGLADTFGQKYGNENVILSDIVKPSQDILRKGKKLSIFFNFIYWIFRKNKLQTKLNKY